MKVAVDLHIHSALSPCSEKDMTPNNIVNMAFLKGLDIIALTDHNSVENCEAVLQCAAEMNIIAVPGMELETLEEVHLVCLFPDLRAALTMQEKVYAALPPLENREDIFGQQIVMDAQDQILSYNKRLLISATGISLEEACSEVRGLNGIVIPAHVDRESYSILSNLGSVPEELSFNYLEVSRNCDTELFRNKNRHVNSFQWIKSSDAHTLGDLLERESFIELEELSIEGLLRKLR